MKSAKPRLLLVTGVSAVAIIGVLFVVFSKRVNTFGLATESGSGTSKSTAAAPNITASASPPPSDSLRPDLASEPPPSSPQRQASTDQNAIKLEHLPAEANLLRKGEINLPAVASLLSSAEAFEKALGMVRSQSAGDLDAQELTRTYREQMAAQTKAMSLDGRLKDLNIACGLSLCLGSFNEASGESSWGTWLTAFEENTQAPHFTTLHASEQSPEGDFQHRFVISVDRSISSVNSPRPTKP